MINILRGIFAIGPLIFGIGFLAPLIAQSMDALALSAPFGAANLAFGLAVGAVLGALATVRGRWV